ncbi:LysR family transcriptional regulator [Serratia sp. PF2-63]|uniref:LysR family transcriptional regulator n=1 Tax=unclassified Serratia (in: enterobacteria) TaxID=2647522 RepID=UPI0024AF4D35|nr:MULTISPECIES: LysR family transcriptional regulator [unclassified Serratia (in: enterobacteria)]EMB6252923.1 LysR family transcriptional regulator [Serratia marcescens]MDI6974277.1 LysR family transcriptional regulator [Serratia sp. Se-RSBMAAmG]MDI9262591.1 LysR family transcriptional regulator [Serratia sp. PF2-63]MDI9270938.1 LysR family transcriptional regulator [Serratia sp. PF-27]
MHAITEVEIFIEVVQQGSFSAAGRSLGLASSVVADRVSSLERRLGVALLLRTTRHQALTEIGKDYFEEGSRIVSDFRALENRVIDSATSTRGMLRVTAPNPLGQCWIAPFVGRFALDYPDIALHLTLDDHFADIIAQRFDIAIRGGPAIDSNLIGRRLFDTRRVVVASPAYLDSHGTPSHPNELGTHRCLIFNTQSHLHAEWRFEHAQAPKKLRITGALATTNASLPVEWAVAGLGLTQKSWWEVADHIHAGRLVTVLDDFEPEPVCFYVIHPVSSQRSRKVALFVEGLIALFDDLDGGIGNFKR